MAKEIDWHRYRPQEDMGMTLDGPRSVRIFPTAKVDLDTLKQNRRHVTLWKQEGSGILSSKVYVKRVEQESKTHLSSDAVVLYRGFRLDVWTDPALERTFHVHQELGPFIEPANKYILEYFMDQYAEQTGSDKDIRPKASFCPTTGLKFGNLDSPILTLKPGGHTKIAIPDEKIEVVQDGSWQGDPNFPFRLNYELPPYCFEKVLLKGTLRNGEEPPRNARVVIGLFFASTSLEEINMKVTAMVNGRKATERLMREIFNPYVRFDVAAES